jgi:hypothetical protein
VANLTNLIAKIPGGATTRYKGVMVASGTGLAVNVNGNIIPATYADPVVVAAGDPVVVDIMSGAQGQAEAVVMGRLTAAARPGRGTVKTVPPASTTITVTGTDGTDYVASFVGSYTPTVSDSVILAWNAATPTVTGKVGATITASPVVTVGAPPGPTTSGTSSYAATDSGTWTPTYGAWDAWAGGGGQVYQGGSGYGAANYGAWFYSGSPAELAGRTITRIQFNIGRRLTVGGYNQPVTLNVYAHTSPNKPGGDVSRTVGPTSITIQPGSGGGNVDLPLTFASVIQAGGGISIAGEPYAGVNGRNVQPDSGLLTIDWTR